MAYPRPASHGRIYLVTRRCLRRQFLLRPSARVNQAVLYCLAEAAAHPDMLWFFTMSNHLHYGLYDPDGSYPVFLNRFHKHLAKVLNCHFGRWGCLLEPEQTSMVELCDAGAVFDKMIYSLTNAVKDHLVARAIEWPGFSSLKAQLDDEELVVRRPEWLFAENTEMPATVRLRFQRPPPFRRMSHREWTDTITKAIRRRERTALDERRANGRRVLGRGAIRAQSAFDYPATAEQRRTIKPTVAARAPEVRVAAISRRVAWRTEYREALATYRAGNANVVFTLAHPPHPSTPPNPATGPGQT